MSHELRTPLNAVRTSEAMKGELSAALAAGLQDIPTTSTRAASLLTLINETSISRRVEPGGTT